MSQIIISDEERSTWKDGEAYYWKMNKDDRPKDISTHHFDDPVRQAWYQMDDLARKFPLNKVPKEVIQSLEDIKKLADIVDGLLKNRLYIALKAYESREES